MNTQAIDELKTWIQKIQLSEQEIARLMAFVETDAEHELVSEALENCKADSASLKLLQSLLNSEKGDQAYWAATLIGRIGEVATTSQSSLVDLACNPGKPAASRQRALWALQQLGGLSSENISKLRRLDCQSDPRTKRLLDQLLQPIPTR